MNSNKTAQKNHDELWPNYISKAKQTDPELIDVFDNFAFDEVISHSNIAIKTRELLTYSMLISMGGTELQVKGHIQGNVNVGNNKETLIDITTQLLPYIGYPRALNALKCLNEVISE